MAHTHRHEHDADWKDEAMLTRRRLLTHSAVGIGAASTTPRWIAAARSESFEFTRTDAEWRKVLTPDQFAVLRKSATERPFTSALLHEKRATCKIAVTR